MTIPPEQLNQQLQRGYALLGEGEITNAQQLLESLLLNHADNAHVLLFASELCRVNGNYSSALQWVDKALLASNGHPSLKVVKARVLQHLRRRTEVAELAKDIALEAGADGRLLWEAGKLLFDGNQLDDAIGLYEQARELIGDQPNLLYNLATARFFNGDFEQAESDLNRILQTHPQAGQVLYRRATLRQQTPEHHHVLDIENRLKTGMGTPENEAKALYALGKELEDLEQYAQSFEAIAAGAKKLRSVMNYNITAETEALRAVQKAWAPEVMAQPGGGHEDAGAIFIVGMPRTGTTLAERLLTQSGGVRSAGELLDFANLFGKAARQKLAENPELLSSAQASTTIDFASLGRDYMRGAREAALGSMRFIDKTPFNYLYCGAIHKALPRARIIHLTRDPVDSCYAVFKTLFFSAYHFSYDLEELADYYIAYRQVMQHWHTVMPGQILDIRYEDLVSDTENQVQKMYAWCGLEWTPQALLPPASHTAIKTASSAQVRQPVHQRSVGSARPYAQYLSPLIDRLHAAGVLAN